MFRSYLTIALRHLKRHKTDSFINISGLALGMACCVLLLLWINNEIRYDRFHEQTKNLYRVVNDLNYGPYSQLSERTAYPLGPAMKEEVPEVKEIVRLLTTKIFGYLQGKKILRRKFLLC